MNAISEMLLGQPFAWRWMTPFAEQRLRPLRENGGISGVRRVLDVACGPGTNAGRFAHADYLGIDTNARHIDSARKRHRGNFVVADVTKYEVGPDQRFDCILVDSMLHHMPTPEVRRLLSHLATLLTDDGAVHIIDLVLPRRPSTARVMARLDRGDHPRPVAEWELIFSSFFEPVVCEPHPIGAFGISLWDMIYFKGRRRSRGDYIRASR
jgi:SAM-dependent methyltransferase